MRMFRSVVLGLLALPALAGAQTAGGQAAAPASERGFVAAHVGGQAGSTDLTDGFTFPQYDETGTVSIRQGYGGGAIFNIEGGFRVTGAIFAGIALSAGSSRVDTNVDASIPHPLIFDRPRTASLTSEQDHSETAFHLFARYRIPVNEQITVGISAGPSFIRVRQDLVTTVSFQEGGAPFTTVTLTGTGEREETATVATANVGANVTYRIAEAFGVDGFFRYARGATDVDGAGGSVEIKGGGTQFGIGIQYRF